MGRLDYAPKLKEIQVTDIKNGIGIFTPKPDMRDVIEGVVFQEEFDQKIKPLLRRM